MVNVAVLASNRPLCMSFHRFNRVQCAPFWVSGKPQSSGIKRSRKREPCGTILGEWKVMDRRSKS